VRLLDAGADDYLVKPFGIAELLARLRVAMRHRGTALQPARTRYRHVGHVGDVSRAGQAGPGVTLDVDLTVPRVLRDGAPVHLTPTELHLLATLVRGAGRTLTHRALLVEVWGADCVEHTHYLRLYMAQLRAKLEPEPAEPRLLLTEPGVGYRLVEPDAESEPDR
jgi:two-component system, OmpR family, KDP operon response regulator KdpE